MPGIYFSGSGDIRAEAADERYPREEIAAAGRRLQWSARRYSVRIKVGAISASGCGSSKSASADRQQSVFANARGRVLNEGKLRFGQEPCVLITKRL